MTQTYEEFATKFFDFFADTCKSIGMRGACKMFLHVSFGVTFDQAPDREEAMKLINECLRDSWENYQDFESKTRWSNYE